MKDSKLLDGLIKQASLFGFELTQSQQELILAYVALLQEWNQKMNLTSIRDPEKIITHHFLDSLVLAGHLPKRSGATLLDVGSGAGFPGAVCAIAYPTLQITLVERIQKKAAFLLALRRRLHLNFQVLNEDLQKVVGTFDIVVSRATFPPETWLKVGAPFVAKQGILCAMLGPNEKELATPLGFVKQLEFAYHVGTDPRVLHIFQKE